MMRFRFESLSLVLALTCGSVASAEMISLEPLKDTTIFEESNSLSNGEGQYLFAGNTGGLGNNSTRRALIAFDLSEIPADAMITDLSLQLHLDKTIAGTHSFSLHLLQADWGEAGSDAPGEEGQGTSAAVGDATWQYRSFVSTTWTNAGGDFVATPSASTLVGNPGFYSWTSPTMVDEAQGWLDDPESNFGWLLSIDNELVSTAKRFDSRESPTPANRPVLNVTFTPEPSSIALALFGLVGAVWFAVRRRGK